MPEVRGSNPVIRKKFMINIFTVKCRKDKNKEKEAWKMALIKRKVEHRKKDKMVETKKIKK